MLFAKITPNDGEVFEPYTKSGNKMTKTYIKGIKKTAKSIKLKLKKDDIVDTDEGVFLNIDDDAHKKLLREVIASYGGVFTVGGMQLDPPMFTENPEDKEFDSFETYETYVNNTDDSDNDVEVEESQNSVADHSDLDEDQIDTSQIKHDALDEASWNEPVNDVVEEMPANDHAELNEEVADTHITKENAAYEPDIPQARNNDMTVNVAKNPVNNYLNEILTETEVETKLRGLSIIAMHPKSKNLVGVASENIEGAQRQLKQTVEDTFDKFSKLESEYIEEKTGLSEDHDNTFTDELKKNEAVYHETLANLATKVELIKKEMDEKYDRDRTQYGQLAQEKALIDYDRNNLDNHELAKSKMAAEEQDVVREKFDENEDIIESEANEMMEKLVAESERNILENVRNDANVKRAVAAFTAVVNDNLEKTEHDVKEQEEMAEKEEKLAADRQHQAQQEEYKANKAQEESDILRDIKEQLNKQPQPQPDVSPVQPVSLNIPENNQEMMTIMLKELVKSRQPVQQPTNSLVKTVTTVLITVMTLGGGFGVYQVAKTNVEARTESAKKAAANEEQMKNIEASIAQMKEDGEKAKEKEKAEEESKKEESKRVENAVPSADVNVQQAKDYSGK